MRATEASAPTAIERRNRLEAVFQAVRAEDLDTAQRLAIEALARGIEHPLLLNLRALRHEVDGRFEASLHDLRRAHVLAPTDFAILNACGLCLVRLDRFEEAVRAYDRALALRDDFGPAWFNRGAALERLGETGRAAESYQKSVELDPRNAQGWANLAWLAARRGDAQDTRRFAQAALARQPNLPTPVLALAAVELDSPAVAQERLEGLLSRTDLSPGDRALALGQLGDALDGLERHAEAFECYRASNALFRADAAPRFGPSAQPTTRAALAWLVPWAERLDSRRWAKRAGEVVDASPAAGHVFILGFPRSGTTLLESVLAAHPDVVTLEERNTLRAAVSDFLTDPTAASRLIDRSGDQLQDYREDYWARVRAFGIDPSGKIFIDKNPFNTLKLPLIYKLFPDARIIFTQRDPRDVVLSCFRRRFDINPSTFELLDLHDAARFYDATMRFARVLAAKQTQTVHRVVYERMIADFEREVRAACAFIGVDERPELIDFAGRAKRGGVASASSAQIARGLYSDGAGQWRRYREELGPLLDLLAPWVEEFGYPPA